VARREAELAAPEEEPLQGLEELLTAKRLHLAGASVVLRDDHVVLECSVRSPETVVELVPLPEVVVVARLTSVSQIGVDHAPDGPQRARLALDPNHDLLGSTRVVATGDDAFGEAPLRRGGLHETDYTIVR